ncbi:hypothetical protein [Ralstonia sp. ASV6]|uniref:hypothetical protein n=1 Tax=Ralstonia sp. ASV6 TaxID=2795124 RepID=UPI0018ED5D7D|nr:hypothetical protein [Ralstonia sp. ASV6]
MKIKISKEAGGYVVDPVDLPGIPPVGRGKTVSEAMGDFLAHYHVQMGLEIELDLTAAEAGVQAQLEAATKRAALYFGDPPSGWL